MGRGRHVFISSAIFCHKVSGSGASSGKRQLSAALSAREETEAFSALRAGDPAAREKLIRHNLRLVAHIVKKYYALPGGKVLPDAYWSDEGRAHNALVLEGQDVYKRQINPRATATVMTVSSVKCDFSLSSGKSLCL